MIQAPKNLLPPGQTTTITTGSTTSDDDHHHADDDNTDESDDDGDRDGEDHAHSKANALLTYFMNLKSLALRILGPYCDERGRVYTHRRHAPKIGPIKQPIDASPV
jgi:hypothetical protein